jgi:hypothetical protein
LGNLRVAFREGNQFTYRATMELANKPLEEMQWQQLNESRDNGLYCTGASAAKLTKNNPLGPWRTLKAGKGDKITFSARPAYKQENSSNLTATLLGFVTAAVGALPPTATAEQRKGWQQLQIGLQIIPAFTPTKNQVKAYIQIIVFDKDYQYIRSEKRIVSKASLDNCGELLEIKYTMPSDGYVQVMTVNESPNQSVWFDDIELVHQENLITQETYYDAFGLELKGIEKTGKPEHRWKFNGKELVDDVELNWYDFDARMYDETV